MKVPFADREWSGALKAWPQWLLEGKPSPTGRFTFTTWHHWTKDDALIDSGLLGPVTLKVAEVKLCAPNELACQQTLAVVSTMFTLLVTAVRISICAVGYNVIEHHPLD